MKEILNSCTFSTSECAGGNLCVGKDENKTKMKLYILLGIATEEQSPYNNTLNVDKDA